MGFSQVDPILLPWAQKNGLTLSGPSGESRSFYVTGGQHESFQVFISLLGPEDVLITAWAVETRDDEEFEHQWRVPIADLTEGLDAAMMKIAEWAKIYE